MIDVPAGAEAEPDHVIMEHARNLDAQGRLRPQSNGNMASAILLASHRSFRSLASGVSSTARSLPPAWLHPDLALPGISYGCARRWLLVLPFGRSGLARISRIWRFGHLGLALVAGLPDAFLGRRVQDAGDGVASTHTIVHNL